MIVSLITDFGTRDYFVAALKARILRECGHAQIVDITHEIPPQNIRQAMFTLNACWRDFPENTCFVSVVDPGVGSDRRIILVEKGIQLFLAPDNGLLSFLFWDEEKPKVQALKTELFIQKNDAQTFHGRDVFAPFAGKLASGADVSGFLETFTAPFIIAEPNCLRNADGSLTGEIIHFDSFGNLITSIENRFFESVTAISVGKISTNARTRYFSSANAGEFFFYPGSAGYIEIALKDDNAAAKSGVSVGCAVTANTGG